VRGTGRMLVISRIVVAVGGGRCGGRNRSGLLTEEGKFSCQAVNHGLLFFFQLQMQIRNGHRTGMAKGTRTTAHSRVVA